ncbi:DUF2117 domain-containing protein [Methanogenium organophilum]|uniref:DUF2117 domain-containing protein n=1 Tax=Methanogenium organophilum TaxID=2199 RepID=A0A9X9T8B7_METOG|nr:DUF2117 domain-containing protein [Methanogenium organophilum]WAI02019.1 DUF2117 domain-containing protein [Methanogenium organophilum]
MPDGCTIIAHGPEVFDTGEIVTVSEALLPKEVIVAGVMARTAAEESGFPCRFNARPPSLVVRHLPPGADAWLLNRGKTPASGEEFGRIVASRSDRPLCHIECSSRTVYGWNGADPCRTREAARRLGFEAVFMTADRRAGHGNTREIRGCRPGEPVFTNGIVIGHATADTAVLAPENGGILAVSGIILKDHGIEKLLRKGPVDLSRAWCKSGPVRSQAAHVAERRSPVGHIAVIDHAACDIYAQVNPGTCGVISIGDDTTAVCGHICAHLGIPVFGVTDGDADTVVDHSCCEGSVIVEVTEGRDDEKGLEIAGTIPPAPCHWDCWVSSTLRSRPDIRIVRDAR